MCSKRRTPPRGQRRFDAAARFDELLPTPSPSANARKLPFCVLQMVRASVRPHLPDVRLLRQDHLRGQQKGERTATHPVVNGGASLRNAA